MVAVTKKSQLTGNVSTREIPVTAEDLIAWQTSGLEIQRALPHLSADDREFLLTGATPEEWDDAFPEED